MFSSDIATWKTSIGQGAIFFQLRIMIFFLLFKTLFVPRVKEGPLSAPRILLYVQYLTGCWESNPSCCYRSQVCYTNELHTSLWATHIPRIRNCSTTWNYFIPFSRKVLLPLYVLLFSLCLASCMLVFISKDVFHGCAIYSTVHNVVKNIIH